MQEETGKKTAAKKTKEGLAKMKRVYSDKNTIKIVISSKTVNKTYRKSPETLTKHSKRSNGFKTKRYQIKRRINEHKG